MSEKRIHIHKFQDGNEAIVVEFGFGKIGIGLEDNCARNLAVHLQELNEPGLAFVGFLHFFVKIHTFCMVSDVYFSQNPTFLPFSPFFLRGGQNPRCPFRRDLAQVHAAPVALPGFTVPLPVDGYSPLDDPRF